eukprot:SAG25_NODE_1098_length_4006_cov_14.152035_2_plen_196_part_00
MRELARPLLTRRASLTEAQSLWPRASRRCRPYSPEWTWWRCWVSASSSCVGAWALSSGSVVVRRPWSCTPMQFCDLRSLRSELASSAAAPSQLQFGKTERLDAGCCSGRYRTGTRLYERVLQSTVGLLRASRPICCCKCCVRLYMLDEYAMETFTVCRHRERVAVIDPTLPFAWAENACLDVMVLTCWDKRARKC